MAQFKGSYGTFSGTDWLEELIHWWQASLRAYEPTLLPAHTPCFLCADGMHPDIYPYHVLPCLPCLHRLWPSGTASQDKLFFFFCNEFCHSNRKGMNTWLLYRWMIDHRWRYIDHRSERWMIERWRKDRERKGVREISTQSTTLLPSLAGLGSSHATYTWFLLYPWHELQASVVIDKNSNRKQTSPLQLTIEERKWGMQFSQVL